MPPLLDGAFVLPGILEGRQRALIISIRPFHEFFIIYIFHKLRPPIGVMQRVTGDGVPVIFFVTSDHFSVEVWTESAHFLMQLPY